MSKVQNIVEQLHSLGATDPAWFTKFENLADAPECTPMHVTAKLKELLQLLDTAPSDLAAGIVFGHLSLASEIAAAHRVRFNLM